MDANTWSRIKLELPPQLLSRRLAEDLREAENDWHRLNSDNRRLVESASQIDEWARINKAETVALRAQLAALPSPEIAQAEREVVEHGLRQLREGMAIDDGRGRPMYDAPAWEALARLAKLKEARDD